MRRENPRYRWFPSTDAKGAQELMARCRALVLSSYHEGGGRVIGESIVVGTPVLAARNDAACCLLGDDYPGLFDAGGTERLAALMLRLEGEEDFRAELEARARELAPQFDPQLELAAWDNLVKELA